jgi:hypothetical protein
VHPKWLHPLFAAPLATTVSPTQPATRIGSPKKLPPPLPLRISPLSPDPTRRSLDRTTRGPPKARSQDARTWHSDRPGPQRVQFDTRDWPSSQPRPTYRSQEPEGYRPRDPGHRSQEPEGFRPRDPGHRSQDPEGVGEMFNVFPETSQSIHFSH